MNNKVVGYGNFIEAIENDFCTIGNIIINPNSRKIGVTSYLVNQLTSLAFDKFRIKYVKISSFNDNTSALSLYHKLGFIPKDTIEKTFLDNKKNLLINMYKYNKTFNNHPSHGSILNML